MKKTRSFSIYLLKQGYDAKNSLKYPNDLTSINATKLPEDASLFVYDKNVNTPWWVDYFGIQKSLSQKNNGALIFIPVENRCFVLSFGYVYHYLINESYEYDFGLRVTLNSLDPQKLKSVDILAPGIARRKRMQIPISSELTYFDFDSNSEILKGITGIVKDEYVNLFKNATGSVSLKVNLKIEPEELIERCQKFLELYESEKFLTEFPNIQKIIPEKDPVRIEKLNNVLVENINKKNQKLILSIPEIIDYSDEVFCKFRVVRNKQTKCTSKLYNDITIDNFYDYLNSQDINEITLETLKNSDLKLCKCDGKITKSFSIYQSLIFDIDIASDNHIYHLCEGEWYRIAPDYLEKLNNSIKNVCEDSKLISYNHDKETSKGLIYCEEEYNKAVVNEAVKEGKNFFCLDRKNISPRGLSPIEPCDILEINKQYEQCVFYHIKISTSSAKLSHLFNQGANSFELLYLEETFRNNLKELLKKPEIIKNLTNIDNININDIIDKKNYKVIFGIITDKDKNSPSDNLPLFSKISLSRILKIFEFSNTKVSLTFIKDESKNKKTSKS